MLKESCQKVYIKQQVNRTSYITIINQKACYLHVKRRKQTKKQGVIKNTKLYVLIPLKVPIYMHQRVPIILQVHPYL